jgi:hypothetical protein
MCCGRGSVVPTFIGPVYRFEPLPVRRGSNGVMGPGRSGAKD